jgi:diguanylate cyclase (GGDEF)-like protein/PAS domain S-box-containing protein
MGEQPFAESRPDFRLRVFELAIAGPLTAWLVVQAVRNPGLFDDPALLVWIGAVAVIDLMPVALAGKELQLSLSFPILLTVALLYEPPVAAAVGLIGSFDRRELKRTVSPLRALFVRSQIAAAVLVESWLFHSLASLDDPLAVQVPAVLVAVLSDYAVNTSLVGIFLHLSSHLSFRQVLDQLHHGAPAEFFLSFAGLTTFGLANAHLYRFAGWWAALAFLVTLMIARQLFFRTKALGDAQRRYRQLVEQIPAVTYTHEADALRTPVFISPQISSLVGFSDREWLSQPGLWTDHIHPADRTAVLQSWARSSETGEPFLAEYRFFARKLNAVWIHDEAVLVTGPDGSEEWRGVMVDITERKRAEEELEYLAYHDRLTGLPNRMMFEELLDRALARARRSGDAVAMLLLDLDNFKLVNDSLGHRAGDELLKETAARLRTAARETDVVARQGGDEFLLLLSDLAGGGDSAIQVAEMVARRIKEAFESPIVIQAGELYVSASMGISVFPLHGDQSVDLMMNADSAMYRSKRAGPGGWLVYRQEGVASLTTLSMATRLTKAVKGDEWVLLYQPLVELPTGKVFGAEALIRWRQSDGNLLLPGQFIGLADEMGMSEPIGEWVLQEVCRQLKDWHRIGLNIDASLNLSPRQLRSRTLTDRILQAVGSSGLDPTSLIVEITEAGMIGEGGGTEDVIASLHAGGVQLAIDDFGTGHSSLARLAHLPIDILKIDRSFVRELPRSRRAASIVTAIIDLARNLGIAVLAEGVETQVQQQFLLDRGCGLGQGDFFSAPVSADALSHRLLKQGVRPA